MVWAQEPSGDPPTEEVEPIHSEDLPALDDEVVPIGDGLAEAEAALAEAQRALEYAPFDPERLAATARRANELDLEDEALYYAHLALEALPAQGSKELRESLLALRTEIGLLGPPLEELQADFSRGLFDMARSCEKKKLYANAADLLLRCAGTTLSERAEERLAALFAKPKAVQGLLASGAPIEVPVRRKVNAKKKRRVDRKHTTWETAYEVKGKYYVVKSDMGYDFTHAFVEAMDQINGFYREVFQYKTRGQDMRTCTIHVYKSRAEFDRHEGMQQRRSTKGFFQPGENRVSTYDQRTDGGSLGSLWSTLFHEASHQFTEIVAPDLKLTWLNEGTASYFEGAYLQPGGRVVTNRIPDSRLRNLKHSLDSQSLALRDVVTYYQDGSYPGAYYPFGWGLVFFFHNYEDDRSERVYLPIYRDFLKSYQSGKQHDVLERFVEYFVQRAAVPGVDSFEAFDAHWQAWIQELHELHFGGPEQADALLVRARRQRGHDQLGYARESLEWALDKNPDHTAVRIELAEVLQALEETDAALYHWRTLERIARGSAPDAKKLPHSERAPAEMLSAAREAIASLHPPLAEHIEATLDGFVERSLESAERYRIADRPLTALQLLQQADGLVGGDTRLRHAVADLRDEEKITLLRGYRPPTDEGLTDWTAQAGWHGTGSAIEVSAEYASTLLYDPAPRLPYRWSVEIELPPNQKAPYVGLLFAADLDSETLFAWRAEDGLASHIELRQEGPHSRMAYPVRPPKGQSGPPSATQVHLEVEVSERELRFYTNGRLVGKHKLRGDSALGRVGLFAQGTQATFRQPRLEY